MSATILRGGRIVDPANGRDAVGDLAVADGRIAAAPPAGARVIDCSGLVVMAGAIDIHSHIAGGHVNTARLLLPESHRASAARPAETALSRTGWTTEETGLGYARMGFTTVVEPAMGPSSALHAHLELADIPIIDKGTLVVLGNDDRLLSMLREGASPAMVEDYVAWVASSTKALGVKCINAGGSAAFKDNARAFSFDDEVPAYGVTSRAIVKALQGSVERLGIPHPLHVHANNLGVPGRSAATLVETIRSAEGQPMHLAHVQFYGYGTANARGFSSEARGLAELVNSRPEITVDVGQVMFGPTVTVSSDELLQFAGRATASLKKFVIVDGDANGGGVVPINYRRASYHNALQWAIGLELFLLIEDPSRVFFTTDHPNGAPFTAYPDLFALLMSRERRAEWLAELPKAVREETALASLSREYDWTEIATMTRSAPARLLGTTDRGHLSPGAVADVAAYRPASDLAQTFARAELVLKDGLPVVEKGEIVATPRGRTLSLAPRASDGRATPSRMDRFYEERYGLSAEWFRVPAAALGGEAAFGAVPWSR